jgi:excisionase family DNA binding protein
MSEKKCLKTSEVALEFGVSHDAITDWVKLGLIRAYKTPKGHYRFPIEEVDKLKEKLTYVPESIKE